MTYEKPEQPPPRMPTRNDASVVPRFFSCRAIASTAWGVTETLVSMLILLPPLCLLLAKIRDGALDGVLREDRAMDLHGREVQLLDDLGVLDRLRFVDRLALDPLGGKRRARDGRTAAERLELRVFDHALIVDADLQAHHVAAGGG